MKHKTFMMLFSKFLYKKLKTGSWMKSESKPKYVRLNLIEFNANEF